MYGICLRGKVLHPLTCMHPPFPHILFFSTSYSASQEPMLASSLLCTWMYFFTNLSLLFLDCVPCQWTMPTLPCTTSAQSLFLLNLSWQLKNGTSSQFWQGCSRLLSYLTWIITLPTSNPSLLSQCRGNTFNAKATRNIVSPPELSMKSSNTGTFC